MHRESKSEKLHVRVTPSTKARVEKWAERSDESVSAYVIRAVQKQLDSDLLSDVDSKITE